MNVRSLTREILFFLLFLLLSILNTYPLILNMRSAVSDPGDPYLNAWILEWDWWATTHRPLSLFQAPIFHPSPYALAFSENMFGIALLFFPLYAAGAGPITVYNVALLCGFAFCGYGAFVLARLVTRTTIPAVAAGIFFAFVPFRFTHLPHIQHIWAGWLPVLLASLVYYFRQPSWGRAALFGAAFLMNGLSNIHWLLFGTLALAFSFVFLVATEPLARRLKSLVPLATATALALLLLLPFLLPYREMSEFYRVERGVGETEHGSARGIDWLMTSLPNRTYGNLPVASKGIAERWLFPGLLSIFFTGCALVLARREDFPLDVMSEKSGTGPLPPPRPWNLPPASRAVLDFAIVATAILGYYKWAAGKDWPVDYLTVSVILALLRLTIRFPGAIGGDRGYSLRSVAASFFRLIRTDPARRRFPVGVRLAIVWIVIGFFSSRGLRTVFYTFLYENLYIFRSIRAPVRSGMIVYVGMAVMVAVGIVALLRRFNGRGKTIASTLIAALFMVELRAAPIRWFLALPEVPPVYSWLESAPIRGAVFELPVGNWEEAEYVLRATAHHRPLINGVSGYYPEIHERIARMANLEPVDPALLGELERVGCSIIIVHNERMNTRPSVRTWLGDLVRDQRLTFVGRFEHLAGGDFVFALNRNEPHAARLAQPEHLDPSGMTPRQKMEQFLAGNSYLYNVNPFGWLDGPTSSTDARGDLRIGGWALAPDGVAQVNLRFENGRVVIPADLWGWTEINRIYPWYPKTDKPGFFRDFPNRPEGLSGDTDLQVEIVDKSGRRTRLEQVMFRWLPRRPAKFNWNAAELDRLLLRLGRDPMSVRPRILSGEIAIEDVAYDWAKPLGETSNTDFVIAMFRAFLNRPPDPTGLAFYLDRLNRGESRNDLLDAMVRSPEFAKIHSRKSL